MKKYLVKAIDWLLVKLGPSPVRKNRMSCWPCPCENIPHDGQLKPRLLGALPEQQSLSIKPTFSASKIPDAEKPWPPKNKMWPPSNRIHKDSPRA